MTYLRNTLFTLALLFTTVALGPQGADAQSQKLTLDGEFDYATAPDSPSLSVGGAITVEAWIKHDGQSDEDAYILHKFDDGDQNGYFLRLVGQGEEVPIKFFHKDYPVDEAITSDAGIPQDRWTHVAVAYDGNTISLYLNGKLDNQISDDTGIGDGKTPLQLGTNAAGNDNFFSGQLDEIRIWNTARSALEIKENRFSELAGDENGLVAYYPFGAGNPNADQGGGNDLTFQGDASAEARDVFPVPPDLYVENEGSEQVSLRWEERTGLNDANAASSFNLHRSPPTGLDGRAQIAQSSASEAPTHTATALSNGKTYFWEVTSVDSEGRESDYSPLITGTPHDGNEPEFPMKGGAALSLDGDKDYATVGDRPSLSFVGDDNKSLTVEAWIKHDGQSDEDAYILHKRDGDAGGNGYRLRLVGQGEEVPVQFIHEDGSLDAEITSDAGIPEDRWTHVAVAYDGNTMSLYLNGKLDKQVDDSYGIGDSRTPLQLGTNAAGNDNFFSGQIDEVRIWDDARTQQQIQDHYQQELTGSEEDLRAYWRFNDAGKGARQGKSIGFATRHADAVLEGDATLSAPGALPLPPRVYARASDATAKLTWSERNQGEASEFTAYRFTGSTSQALATQSASNTSYTDTGISNATDYTYRVTTLNAQGQESDYAHPAPVTPAPRPLGNALSLDGDKDYGTVGDRPSLSFVGEDNKSLTVEAWIKRDGQSDEDAYILHKRDGTTGGTGYRLRLVGQGEEVPVQFIHEDGSLDAEITSDAGIPEDRWTHVAVAYDGNTMSLYLNGKLDKQVDDSYGIGDSRTPLQLGTNAAGNDNFFSGQIDEVRIWDDARTKQQILQHYRRELVGNEQALLGYWRFNETPGTSVARAAAERPKTVSLSGDADFTDSAIETQEALSAKTVASDEAVDFGPTGAAADFAGTSGSGTVIAEKFDSTPETPQGISQENISDYRFAFRADGDLEFGDDTEVRFDASTLDGVNTPSDVTIYKRSEQGEGSFTTLPTTYDADAGELVVTTGSFSEFVLASDSEPLPVEMAGFEGTTVEENRVRLTWQTTSETNNAGFEVQRRAGERGSWTEVGFVESKAAGGTTSEAMSYQFEDADLPYAADKLAYRLRQVDVDGSESLSDRVTIQRTVDEVELLGTFPNPARTQTTVQFAVPGQQKVALKLYDVMGREVRTLARGPQEGRTEMQVGLSGLPSGIYFLRLQAGGTTKTQKMTVVR
jgi:hypothetical protein